MFDRSERSSDHLAVGRAGERRAAWFYRFRGYRILGRNVVLGRGEIDLVVRRGRTLVFVEVKTRLSSSHGEPWQAVDRDKRRQLIGLARRYLATNDTGAVVVRFDVVSIVRAGRRWKLDHYPDAFRPEADPIRPWVLR